MGADLILSMAEMPLGEWDAEAWHQHFRKQVMNLPDGVAIATYDEWSGDLYLPDEDDLIRSKEQRLAGAARDGMLETVDEYLTPDTGVAYNARDCVFYQIRGGWILITGGMSWGDSPSDSWHYVWLLEMLA